MKLKFPWQRSLYVIAKIKSSVKMLRMTISRHEKKKKKKKSNKPGVLNRKIQEMANFTLKLVIEGEICTHAIIK